MNLSYLQRYYQRNKGAIRFLLLFSLFFASGEIAYSLLETLLSPIFVDLLTAKASALLINFFSPAAQATAQGPVISSVAASLSIAKGCEGVEGLIIVLSAVAAYPSDFRRKATGLVLGAVIIYVLNLLRVVVLFHAVQQGQGWFDFLHIYVGQTFTIFAGVAFFLLWSGRLGKENG
jgi:exosortase family protein XrtM